MTKKEREQKTREGIEDLLESMQQRHIMQTAGSAQEMKILYDSFVKVGFTKAQAMDLLKTMMSAAVSSTMKK